ncbi:MAG: cytochrome o ubiquinol oxidase subunit IV [Nitrososphaera sp.]|nr:cytochrome o ubiquinol oxidase subunit IV [Nitrososphaera sp.]
MSNDSPTNTSNIVRGGIRSYVCGFVLSIALTLIAFYLVDQHVRYDHRAFSHEFLYTAITVLAIAQLFVQLELFLHVRHGSRLNVVVFAFAGFLVAIVVGGSLWIMSNLNYNMMQMSPAESDHYMLDQ